MLGDYSLRPSRLLEAILLDYKVLGGLSYGPSWAHYLGGYQDRLLHGPLGLPDLCRTVREVQGLRWRSTRIGSYAYHVLCRGLQDVYD
jgi:hypothetical protein